MGFLRSFLACLLLILVAVVGLQYIVHQLQMAVLDIVDINDPPHEFLAFQTEWEKTFKSCEALDIEENTTKYTRLSVSSLEELD